MDAVPSKIFILFSSNAFLYISAVEPYDLKRGPYKNLTLRVLSDGRLRVSAPWFAPQRLIDGFVASKARWIAEKRSTLVPTDPGMPTEVPVWGRLLRVRVESPGKLPRVVWDEPPGDIVVRVPASWGPLRVRRLLDEWEKQRVAEVLAEKVPQWAAKMGLAVDRWTVKRLRSRWGSCRPSTRSLVFNAALGALDPRCLDYVVVHELVHLWEPSHNPRFHRLVEDWLPGSPGLRALLRRSGGPSGSAAFPAPPARPGEETAL